MDEKDKKIAELEQQVEMLKKQLGQANMALFRLQEQIRRQFRYDQDYLPYPDDEYDR